MFNAIAHGLGKSLIGGGLGFEDFLQSEVIRLTSSITKRVEMESSINRSTVILESLPIVQVTLESSLTKRLELSSTLIRDTITLSSGICKSIIRTSSIKTEELF